MNKINDLQDRIVVVNFGGQYAHLIAKQFRHLGYLATLVSPTIDEAELTAENKVRGIVLSGGPASVLDAVPCNEKILDTGLPMLGLCYGHQLIHKHFGGVIKQSKVAEFGKAELRIFPITSPLFKGVDTSVSHQVWMSHNDEVRTLAKGFMCLGSTDSCHIAATQCANKKTFTVQFHPEVVDTPMGKTLFENFANYCKMDVNWDANAILKNIILNVQRAALNKKVVLLLSGGVDSTVCFALLNRALGSERVLGIHIDNGFMRENESAIVAASYMDAGLTNFISIDASGEFLQAVNGITDPQQKRLAIGTTFIKVAEDAFRKNNINLGDYLLCQGTLYPDIIESGGAENADTIKTHHNRVPAVLELQKKGLVIEPLADLYKDEVRDIGRMLSLSDKQIMRHPFPGPGLSINVLCSDGKVSDNYSEAAGALASFATKKGLEVYSLPTRSVGVQGDGRTYRFPCVISLESSLSVGDAADVAPSIINELGKFNRVIIELWRRSGLSPKDLRLQPAYCTKDRLDILRKVDKIVTDLLVSDGLYNKIFQSICVLLPCASEASHMSVVLRPVVSEDVMTCRAAILPASFIGKVVGEISAIRCIDALYYDVTSKPPATFCWE